MKNRLVEVGPLTMIHRGKPVSLASPLGALTVLHGALQAGIGDIDDALAAEKAYLQAVAELEGRAGD